MNTTILDIRPGLSGQIARAREALPADARMTLDEHVTQAERLVEDVFGDVVLWKLRGSDSLWVRSADLAEVMEVTQQAISTQILGAEASAELVADDVRRGVRSQDVDPSSHKDSLWLTTSPTGVTMVTLRAARLLVMSCRGERGVRFRAGLDRLLETASATERLLVALLLDRTGSYGSPDPKAAIRIATGLRLAGDKAGAVQLLRRLAGLPELPPEPVFDDTAWFQQLMECVPSGPFSAADLAKITGGNPLHIGLELRKSVGRSTRTGRVLVRHPTTTRNKALRYALVP